MHAKQYELRLPADYDMAVIRHRVATRGHLTDAYGGLGLKAYLIRERGTGGSPVNEYAPFYLWADTSGMNRFLWGGGGFRGIIEDFGRPAVRNWLGAAFEQGPARGTTPRAATRHAEAIPAGVDPTDAVERALGELKERAATPGVHSTALAIDPLHWELMQFTLWEHTAGEAPGTHYQVLHLSIPHLADLRLGRHW